ncbi:MAG: ComEC/Rec2 family competence protein, partial [Pseudomonadota bacterium]
MPLLAGSYCLGIIIFSVSQVEPKLILVAGGLCSIAFCCLRRSGFWWATLFCLSVMACGAFRASVLVLRHRPKCHVSNHVGPTQVQVVARVKNPTVFVGDGQRQLLQALWMKESSHTNALCGSIELYRPLEAKQLWPGEIVRFVTRLKKAVGPRNPRVRGPQLRYLSDDVGVLAHVDVGTVVIIEPAEQPWLIWFRDRIRKVIESVTHSNSSARSILSALVLGDRQGLDPEQRRRFSRAGVSHLLAVSGLHLSLVSAAVMLVLQGVFRRSTYLARWIDCRRFAAIGAGVVAVSYTLLTGAAPATVRACVMVCTCFLGLAIGRASDFVRPLSLAAFGLLAYGPLNLFLPGFQLSFVAVIGIVLGLRQIGYDSESSRGRLYRAIRMLFVSTAAATLMTAPLVAHHFGEVSVVGVLTNLVAIPLTSFALLPLSLLGSVLGAISLGLGTPILWLGVQVANGLDWICAFVAGLDGATLSGTPSWSLTIGLCVLSLALLVGGKASKAIGALAVVLICVVFVLEWLAVKKGVDATFLDVG